MSKAEEYRTAVEIHTAKAPPIERPSALSGIEHMARITDEGRIAIHGTFTATEAAKLISWLGQVLGE